MEDKTDTSGRRWSWLALLVLLLVAWGLRMRGVEWPLLHPDEYKITAWAYWIEEHTQTLDTVYPGGYFHLVKPILLIKNALLDGLTAWQSFLGHGDAAVRSGLEQTFLLRKINVGFALLTVALFYGLAFRVTRSRGGALAAAAFLGLSVLHIEHSHYAETDIAMLLTLTAALYGWIRVCEGRKLLWVCVVAFLSGLAIGTKYTSLLLVPVGIAAIVMGVRANPCLDKGARRVFFIALSSILLLAGGLYYANRHITDGSEYWRGLRAAGQAVYGERTGLLGQAVDNSLAGLISNWNTLMKVVSGISPVWLALILFGGGRSLRARYRWCWPVTWLPLGLYLFYCLKLAPWIRGQECLVFFPMAAVFIAVGVEESLSWARRVKYRKWAFAGVAAIVAVACFESGLSALRDTSLFALPEPRIQAMKWLYGQAPLQKKAGVEDYTVPACRLFDSAYSVGQIEWMTPMQRDQAKFDYLLRNVSSTGRGTADPRTHELYPNFAQNLAGFKQQARRLCHWGVSGIPYSFVGNEIEWWDARSVAPTVTIESPLFRPVLVDRHPYVAVPLSESGVGCGTGLKVEPEWKNFVVGGEVGTRRSLFVVLQTEAFAADFVVNGMGDRHSIHVDPYDVAVVLVKRPWFIPRTSVYDVVSVKSNPTAHFRDLACQAQVAMSTGEVAMLLFQKGYPDKALQWMPPESGGSGWDWLRYSCAVAKRDWVQAARLEAAARQSLEKFEAAGSIPGDQLLLNGCSGSAWRDHSRLRLPMPDTGWNGIEFSLPAMGIRLTKEEESREFTSTLNLPMRLAPGVYTVCAELKSQSYSETAEPWKMRVGDSLGKDEETILVAAEKPVKISRRITVDREQNLALNFASGQRGGKVELSRFEIRWNEDVFLWAERRELYRALIRHALQKGDPEAVQALLKKARISIPDGKEWERFEQGGRLVERMGVGVFYPWIKLVDVEVITRDRMRIRFESLKDNPPPLKVRAYRKAFGGPRQFYEGALPARNLSQGDTVVLELPLPAKTELADISLRMIGDGKWTLGQLHVEGTRDDRLWLER